MPHESLPGRRTSLSPPPLEVVGVQPAADWSAAAPLLALDGVAVQLGKRTVLDGATLHAPEGSVTCVAGANGAGKTTLLRVAAGLLTPGRGEVRLAGMDMRRDRRACVRRLGFASAGNQGLYARLTVARNLRLWAALAFVPFAARDAAVSDALRDFGLEEIAGRRMDRLSLGQRQRARLAMAFLHRPDVVLLDEPHTSLDDEGLEHLAKIMCRLATGGGAVLWAAPSPDHAGLPSDRVAIVVGGRVETQ